MREGREGKGEWRGERTSEPERERSSPRERKKERGMEGEWRAREGSLFFGAQGAVPGGPGRVRRWEKNGRRSGALRGRPGHRDTRNPHAAPRPVPTADRATIRYSAHDARFAPRRESRPGAPTRFPRHSLPPRDSHPFSAPPSSHVPPGSPPKAHTLLRRDRARRVTTLRVLSSLQGRAHHGSVGWMSIPLTRSERCVNVLCKGGTGARDRTSSRPRPGEGNTPAGPGRAARQRRAGPASAADSDAHLYVETKRLRSDRKSKGGERAFGEERRGSTLETAAGGGGRVEQRRSRGARAAGGPRKRALRTMVKSVCLHQRPATANATGQRRAGRLRTVECRPSRSIGRQPQRRAISPASRRGAWGRGRVGPRAQAKASAVATRGADALGASSTPRSSSSRPSRAPLASFAPSLLPLHVRHCHPPWTRTRGLWCVARAARAFSLALPWRARRFISVAYGPFRRSRRSRSFARDPRRPLC